MYWYDKVRNLISRFKSAGEGAGTKIVSAVDLISEIATIGVDGFVLGNNDVDMGLTGRSDFVFVIVHGTTPSGAVEMFITTREMDDDGEGSQVTGANCNVTNRLTTLAGGFRFNNDDSGYSDSVVKACAVKETGFE